MAEREIKATVKQRKTQIQRQVCGMFALLFIIRKKNLLKSTKLITKVKVKVINTASKTKLHKF